VKFSDHYGTLNENSRQYVVFATDVLLDGGVQSPCGVRLRKVQINLDLCAGSGTDRALLIPILPRIRCG
jgi:hypothetical protein